ncbi:MAG: 2-aminoethylphosphonate--pyruvate transaminase [Granulosicoccus sp.]
MKQPTDITIEQADAEAPALDAPRLGEPYLLTPGPLTTAYSVKQAMLRDWGSWDGDFRALTRHLRSELLSMIDDVDGLYDCVPMQGSGTFAVEAMLGSLLPANAGVLVLSNGAYGKRAAQILQYLGRRTTLIDKGDYLPPRGEEVASALAADSGISHVMVIHCETSSGILNPLEEIAAATREAERSLLIDSMSAFGALPLSCQQISFDALVSSANKCIEGVPGFGFVIVRKRVLETAKGNSHSLSLDLHDQWRVLETTGQWRYTPPTHVVAAFVEALRQHREAGGVAARAHRYSLNRDVLVAGMRRLGFETLLFDRWLSPIIVTFFSPAHQNFQFDEFYRLMKERGFIIYPGKLTEVDSFRLGCIGQMDAPVMHSVVRAASEALAELGVDDPSPAPEALALRDSLNPE